MKRKCEVSVVKGEKTEQMVNQAISMIGGMKSIVKKGDIVLIKPNICLPLPPEKGDATDPIVVASLVKLAKAAGASRVIVGESAGWGLYAPDNFEISKIGEYAKKEGAELSYLDEE